MTTIVTLQQPVPFVTRASTLVRVRWRALLVPLAQLMTTLMHQPRAEPVMLGLSARRELWSVRCVELDRSARCLANHPAMIVALGRSRNLAPRRVSRARLARTIAIAMPLQRAMTVVWAASHRRERPVVTIVNLVKSTPTKMPVLLAQRARLDKFLALQRFLAKPALLVRSLLVQQSARSALSARTQYQAQVVQAVTPGTTTMIPIRPLCASTAMSASILQQRHWPASAVPPAR